MSFIANTQGLTVAPPSYPVYCMSAEPSKCVPPVQWLAGDSGSEAMLWPLAPAGVRRRLSSSAVFLSRRADVYTGSAGPFWRVSVELSCATLM